MPNGIVCPIDGTQLVLVNSVNLAGDPIHRWECPIDDWAGPWYSRLLSGENEPMPELRRDVNFISQPVTTVISGTIIVDPVDDYNSFEAGHQVIPGSTDITFVFTQAVRAIRISNWNVFRILVKDGPITSNSDTTAARVTRSIVDNVPGRMWFPFATSSIHLRSRFDAEVTVEGYLGRV